MYIEQWIMSSDVVSLPVHHARLRINSTCVVLLTSFDDPECPGHLTPPSQNINIICVNITNNLSKPVHTTTSTIYNSTEPIKEQEMTSEPTGTLNKNVSTTSSISNNFTTEVTSSQPMTTINNNQLITAPQLTTGSLNQGHTAQNEEENVSPVDNYKQPQFNVGVIVGGAVTTVFIITAGIVIMFVLYSVLKYCQTAKQLRYGTT